LVLGINYVYEPMDWLKKTQEDVRFDYALMCWVLGANAIKLWGQSVVVFDHVKLAHEEGLQVWLEYCPVYALETSNPDITVEDYCKPLALWAQAAEREKVEVLVVGHEVDLYLKRFSDVTGALRKAVDAMIKTARDNYHGLITYCTWSLPYQNTNINWESSDIVFPQQYNSDCTRALTDNEYLSALLRWKSKIPGKPLAISEFGSLTMSEAAALGACTGSDKLAKEGKVTYDPTTQANLVEKQLQILFKADVYGIFLHMWDEQEAIPIHGWDRNKLGFGIWDYKSQIPKSSFWVVYKYYKER
jgi:hypothetical protein